MPTTTGGATIAGAKYGAGATATGPGPGGGGGGATTQPARDSEQANPTTPLRMKRRIDDLRVVLIIKPQAAGKKQVSCDVSTRSTRPARSVPHPTRSAQCGHGWL